MLQIPELPLLMKAEMVDETLRNIQPKTNTRRTRGLKIINESPDEWKFDRIQDGYSDGRPRFVFLDRNGDPIGIKCPYGAPGFHLWVRETFYIDHVDYIGKPLADLPPIEDGIYYRVDGECCDQIPECQCASPEVGKPAWRPSIFMPRWASRITLDILDIRVERLNDISEEDAVAEGCEAWEKIDYSCLPPVPDRDITAREEFQKLWERINGAGSWKANPWVWVVVFKRLTP
jgi:hypothetical protein